MVNCVSISQAEKGGASYVLVRLVRRHLWAHGICVRAEFCAMLFLSPNSFTAKATDHGRCSQSREHENFIYFVVSVSKFSGFSVKVG